MTSKAAFVLDPKKVAKKFADWRKDNKISMKKIGEILSPDGEKPDAKNYITYYKRAERFINGNHAMRLTDIQKVCDFTGLSVEYFCGEITPKNRLKNALKDLGKSESEIKEIVKTVA